MTFSGTIQKAAISAMEQLLAQLVSSGDLASMYPAHIVSLEERSAILRMPELMELQARYASEDPALLGEADGT